jgi:hypothetical protein
VSCFVWNLRAGSQEDAGLSPLGRVFDSLASLLKVHRGVKNVAQSLADIATNRGACRSDKRHFERFRIIKQVSEFKDYLLIA